MSGSEAARHAETILRLYTELLVQPRRAEPLKVVESAAIQSPPRYLAGN
jgi:hypothetical protein